MWKYGIQLGSRSQSYSGPVIRQVHSRGPYHHTAQERSGPCDLPAFNTRSGSGHGQGSRYFRYDVRRIFLGFSHSSNRSNPCRMRAVSMSRRQVKFHLVTWTTIFKRTGSALVTWANSDEDFGPSLSMRILNKSRLTPFRMFAVSMN